MRTRNVNAAIAFALVAFAALSIAPLPARAEPPPVPSTASVPAAPPSPSSTVSVSPTGTLSPAAVAKPPAAAPPQREELQPLTAGPSVKRRTVALYAAGVAVVGAGVACVFGGLALKNKHDYQGDPTYSNSDDGNNDAAYADGGIALAVAAGITSLVLLLTSDADDASPATSAPQMRAARSSASPTAPSFTLSGGATGALLRF